MKTQSAAAFTAKAQSAFRDLLEPDLNAKAYGFGAFDEMGTRKTTRELSYKLFDFARSPKQFSRFVAIFRRPVQLTEREFEICLELQLRELQRLDPSKWPTRSDCGDEHFSFCFAGKDFDVIGMHAHSSQTAHRFRWPTLVFNPHRQFQRSQVGSAHGAEMSDPLEADRGRNSLSHRACS
jgi:FPC/CPF motif-containing protein YcgG